MQKYGLLVKIGVSPKKREELANILLEASLLSRGAKGCLSYQVHLDNENDNTIWITEVWDSKEAHAEALTLDGVDELVARAQPMIKSFERTKLCSYWVQP